MKLCTFEVETHVGRQRRLGAVMMRGTPQAEPEVIVDLNFAAAYHFQIANELPNFAEMADAALPPRLRGLLEGGEQALRLAEEALRTLPAELVRGSRGETIRYAPEQVRMLTPLPDPRSIRDFYAFEQHVKTGFKKRGEEVPAEWYEFPVYYQTGHHNVLGTDQDVLWPAFTERFDYELELAAVIGKQGRNVKASEARSYIAGYTILNDFSARDIQRREMKVRLGPAKGKHWAVGLGPWLVTRDEIADPYALTMTARVNGKEWSRGNSGDIHWTFEQMIQFFTQDDMIYPGDVFGSGTVGTGCGLELDRWVKPDDVIELEIESIGVLRNRVVKAGS